MANHKSAKKRITITAKRTKVNDMRRSKIRTAVKKAEVTIANGSKEDAKKAFIKAESEMSKGASKGVFHKNTVARKISRLAKKLKAMVTK